MGLYVSFTPKQFGYPETLHQSILQEFLEVEVDYAEACQAFCDVFIDVATTLVPVDTGYLQSTIDASTDGYECEAEATAEYAQYVEYGTWKMAAQPYFTPALEEALAAFHEIAMEAVDEAQEMLQDLCEEVIAEAGGSMGFGLFEGGGFLGEIGGMLLGGAMLWLMFPLLLYAYGIMDTIFGNNDNKRSGPGASLGVDIIIT